MPNTAAKTAAGVARVLNALLMAMVVLTFVDVVGRRLFNSPVYGANDITEHLMALIVFTGLPLLTHQRAHLSVDLFDRWTLRPHWRLWHRLVNVAMAGLLALMALEYFHAVTEAAAIHEVSAALLIPRSWMYAYISLCCALASGLALLSGLPSAHGVSAETQGEIA